MKIALRAGLIAMVMAIVIASGDVAWSVVPPGDSAGPTPVVTADRAPAEVVVRFKQGTTSGDKERAHIETDTEVLSEIPRLRMERLRSKRGESVDALLRSFAQNPNVEYVEPNYIVTASAVPNDPRFSDLWGLHNIGQTGGMVDADIDAPEAWDLQTGSSGLVVGVIDSGIDYNHPDLTANVWTNPGEVAGNGIDDDHNGYVDDIRGWDFVNNDNNPLDDYGHGTHVSGTIGAVGNNGVGVVGVAWQLKILPVKFLDATGTGTSFDAASAIVYAADMGAKVLNASWGCSNCFPQVVENAIAYADQQGVVFVASAGNEATNNDVIPSHPCGSSQPNVLCVAATTAQDGLASFSNYGAATVDLGAPGVSILSTVPNGGCAFCAPSRYLYASGTSMAAPHVAGAAALVFSESPTLSVAEVKQAILDTVDPVPALAGVTMTGGRLNAAAALAQVGPVDLTMTDVTPNAASVNAGSTLSVSDTTFNQGTSAAGSFTIAYHLSTNTSSGDGDDIAIATTRAVGSLGGGASNVASTALAISGGTPAGNYYVCAIADAASAVIETNEANNALCSPSTVTVPPPDLIVTSVFTGSSVLAPGDAFNVSDSVANQGGSAAGAFLVDFHLSSDPAYGGTDDITLSATRPVPSLSAGATSSGATTQTIPLTAPLGNYYVCAKADSGNAVSEGTAESNNTLCSAPTIRVAIPSTNLGGSGSSSTGGGSIASSSYRMEPGVVGQGVAGSGGQSAGYQLESGFGAQIVGQQ
ncbi:MAG: S8 family serine peptidase [Nitrospirota bacterium]